MAPWRVLAAVLVMGLSLMFVAVFIQQRRRIRYALRNRLIPLRVMSETETPIQRWLPWSVLGMAVVLILAALAFA